MYNIVVHTLSIIMKRNQYLAQLVGSIVQASTDTQLLFQAVDKYCGMY